MGEKKWNINRQIHILFNTVEDVYIVNLQSTVFYKPFYFSDTNKELQLNSCFLHCCIKFDYVLNSKLFNEKKFDYCNKIILKVRKEWGDDNKYVHSVYLVFIAD